jgi:hypothetical protein
MERNQFKAFQPVLVRNSENAHWKTAHYSNYNEQRKQHFCDNQPWNHVIPYNELTASLIGTTNAVSEEELNDILETFRYWEEKGNYQDSIFD